MLLFLLSPFYLISVPPTYTAAFSRHSCIISSTVLTSLVSYIVAHVVGCRMLPWHFLCDSQSLCCRFWSWPLGTCTSLLVIWGCYLSLSVGGSLSGFFISASPQFSFFMFRKLLHLTLIPYTMTSANMINMKLSWYYLVNSRFFLFFFEELCPPSGVLYFKGRKIGQIMCNADKMKGRRLRNVD